MHRRPLHCRLAIAALHSAAVTIQVPLCASLLHCSWQLVALTGFHQAQTLCVWVACDTGERGQASNSRGRELPGGQALAAAALLHQHCLLPAAES